MRSSLLLRVIYAPCIVELKTERMSQVTYDRLRTNLVSAPIDIIT
jgi:hypothetical protein